MDLTNLYSTYERINIASPKTLLNIVLYSYIVDYSSRSMALNCKFHVLGKVCLRLIYLCRTFDHIKKGEVSYLSVMPAHHISILDFSLPHLSKEFYSHFYTMNPKTYEIYSDKLYLSVLNLRHRELATTEEKRHGLDKWARAFLADTWEEFQMLTCENTDFKKVADSVYKILADEGQREACRRYGEQRAEMEQALRQIDEQKETIREQSTELQKAKLELQEKDALIEKLKKDLEELKK